MKQIPASWKQKYKKGFQENDYLVNSRLISRPVSIRLTVISQLQTLLKMSHVLL